MDRRSEEELHTPQENWEHARVLQEQARQACADTRELQERFRHLKERRYQGRGEGEDQQQE